jgi:hypothetical protein
VELFRHVAAHASAAAGGDDERGGGHGERV